MRKIILIVALLVTTLFASKGELLFWKEVKNSNDVELLKLYKKQYPQGIFKPLADIKIKRLMKARIKKDKNPDAIPLWIKGDNIDYKYFGVGNATVHFKGKEYQEYLAKKRAKRELKSKLDDAGLSEKKKYEYLQLMQTKKYVNKRKRIYILLYIDNYDL